MIVPVPGDKFVERAPHLNPFVHRNLPQPRPYCNKAVLSDLHRQGCQQRRSTTPVVFTFFDIKTGDY